MANVAAWFRREDYERIRQIMDDGHQFPATFDEWEQRAKRQVADAAAHGVVIEPVILDPDEFVAFCQRENLPNRGSRERAHFAVWRRTAKDMH